MYSSNPTVLTKNNKLDVNDKTLQLHIPSVTGNLRPSGKIKKDFPSLPYTAENQQIIKNSTLNILI